MNQAEYELVTRPAAVSARDKMQLLRKCMCLDLRTGSVVIGIVRLIHWLLILSSMAYIWAQIFIMQNGGMFHLKARTNIEKNCKSNRIEYLHPHKSIWLSLIPTTICHAVKYIKQNTTAIWRCFMVSFCCFFKWYEQFCSLCCTLKPFFWWIVIGCWKSLTNKQQVLRGQHSEHNVANHLKEQ